MLQRIIELRNSLNLTQKDFALKIGLSPSTFSYIENQKSPITERTIISICAKFNVNEEWLRNGKGEMFNKVNKRFNEFFEIYNQLSPELQQFLYNTAKELLKIQNKI